MKHILLTNHTLDNLAGSELYIYELAREYKKRGFQVTCFTLKPGEISDRLAQFGITTTNDLSSVTGVDIIHSHHRLEFKIAAAYFPHVPLVHGSLGPVHPYERPTGGKAIITRYVAVSQLVCRILVEHESVSAKRIDVVPNFVDLDRFTATNRIHDKPRRVLLLSNYYREEEIVRKACELAGGLELSWIGENSTPVWEVEKYIEQADIVITLGRGALQAIAMGRAVIVSGPISADGLVTPDNFENMVACNFNGRISMLHVDSECKPFNAAELAEEIKKYDRVSAEALVYKVREEFNVSRAAGKLLTIYDQAANQFKDEWAGNPQARLEAVLHDLGEYLVFLKEADDYRESIPEFRQAIVDLTQGLENKERNRLKLVNELNEQSKAYHQQHKIYLEQNQAFREQIKAYLELQDEYRRTTAEFARLEDQIKNLKNLVIQISSGRVMRTLNFLNKSLNRFKRVR